jgi:hypothetical protein
MAMAKSSIQAKSARYTRCKTNIMDDMRSGRDQRPRGRFNANRSFNRRKDGKQLRYWSVVENTRVAGRRVVQRHVLADRCAAAGQAFPN